MERTTIAYALILLLMLAAAAFLAFKRCHGRERRLRRQGARDVAAYNAVMAAKQAALDA